MDIEKAEMLREELIANLADLVGDILAIESLLESRGRTWNGISDNSRPPMLAESRIIWSSTPKRSILWDGWC